MSFMQAYIKLQQGLPSYFYWNIGIKIQVQTVYRLSEFINANSESLNANLEYLNYSGRLNVNSEYFRQRNQKFYLA